MIILLVLLLLATPVWAVDPTLPQLQAPSVRPTYTPLRSFSATTEAQFLTWWNGTGTSGPCLGDEMIVSAGVTITQHLFMKKACGTQVTPGTGGPPAATLTLAATGPAVTPPAATFRPPLAVTTGDTLYVVIRSSDTTIPPGTRPTPADASKLYTITAPCCATGGNYAIDVNQPDVGYYWFRGMRLTAPAVRPSTLANFEYVAGRSNAQTQQVHHIVLEQTLIHPHPDYGVGFCVQFHGAYLTLMDSYAYDCTSPGDGEGKLIWATFGTGPILITNNHIDALGIDIALGFSASSGPAGTEGDPFLVPGDVTITRNHFTARLSQKRDHATYAPMMDTAGVGTLSTSSTTATFGTSQSGLIGRYIRLESGPQAGQIRKITAGSGTTWTLASAYGANQSAVSWRRNNAELGRKNCLEIAGAKRVLVEGNVMTDCWLDGQAVSGVQLTPKEGGTVRDVWIRYNKFERVGNPFGYSPFNPNEPTPVTNRWAFDHNLTIDTACVECRSLLNERKSHWIGGGPSALVGNEPQDVKIRHNTMGVGTDTGTQWAFIFIDCGQVPQPKMKRFEITNNILLYGDMGANGSGIRQLGCTGPNSGTLDHYTLNTGADTRVVAKNVWFGPSGIAGDASTFTGIDGPAGTNNTFSQVLLTGTETIVGFTNVGTGDYSLSGASAFENWGSDGTDPGVDWPTLQLKILGVVP